MLVVDAPQKVTSNQAPWPSLGMFLNFTSEDPMTVFGCVCFKARGDAAKSAEEDGKNNRMNRLDKRQRPE
jgi:hypothetical protein